MKRIFFALTALTVAAVAATTTDPNILFILTDDQDIMLDSMNATGPCKTIVSQIGGQGATFKNAFANTPICCPSRAEITTGRLMHNTKVFDNRCGGQEFINGAEKLNVAATLKAAKPHYRTFYAGKYLNNYGTEGLGGIERIPPGWDEWYGLKGNSKYYHYEVSNQGKLEKHGGDYEKDYFTDRVANRSLEFMRNQIKHGNPFFMTVATPASHGPNTPAPQYAETYAGMKAPRLPSYNVTGQRDKSYLMREIIPMDRNHANVSDVYFQRRWSVLRSVDDMVQRFLDTLESTKVLDNTYILFTSDHGYHLGEFGMLYDKRMLYETDIRIPFLVRGPQISNGQLLDIPINHVDIAPTILDMAGAPVPKIMDGRSWLPLVQGRGKKEKTTWRSSFMVEYSGGNPLPNMQKSNDAPTDVAQLLSMTVDVRTENDAFAGSIPVRRKSTCAARADDESSITGQCSCSIGRISGNEHDISPCDGKNNTYACIRTLNGEQNTMYCEFNDPEHHVELYDLESDPYNLNNLVGQTSRNMLKKHHESLITLQTCKGSSECFN